MAIKKKFFAHVVTVKRHKKKINLEPINLHSKLASNKTSISMLELSLATKRRQKICRNSCFDGAFVFLFCCCFVSLMILKMSIKPAKSSCVASTEDWNSIVVHHITILNWSHDINYDLINILVIALNLYQKNTSQPVIDVVVVLVALPTLMILALLLEANTRGNWLETSQTRFTVLGLGVALAVVCLAIVMYVTSRLGKKFLWTGPLPSETNGPHYSYYVSIIIIA